MEVSEAKEIVEQAFEKRYAYSSQDIQKMREALLAAHEVKAHEEKHFRALDALETSWKLLEFKDHEVSREYYDSEHPLAVFLYFVDGGHYPPPEILLIIYKAIDFYISQGGDVSLDQAIFGAPHKKTQSLPYRWKKRSEYSTFHNYWVSHKTNHPKFKDMSMDELVADYFKYMSSLKFKDRHDKKEIGTFLKGYNRWLKKWEKEKPNP